jgi:hypothetical protein
MEQVRIERLDHLGLIACVIKDLGLIDSKGSSNPLPKLAMAHRVIIGLGAILGHNAPVRWEPSSALVGQVSMARTSLAASRASEADMALSVRNVIRQGRS